MTISIVTVNFNSQQETHNLLANLQKVHTEGFSLDVIVVDNASKVAFELNPAEIKQRISLFQTKQNLGFTGGYNLGIRKALENDPDYVVLLNNDTIVEPHCLQHILKTFQHNKSCGIVVPKIYFAKGHEFHADWYKDSERGKVFWYAGGYMDWENVFSKHKGVDEVDKGQYDQEEQVDFATGCCMVIRSDVLKKVGLLGEKLFLYYEDADISQRVLRAGYSIIYQPKAVIWHINAASGGGAGSILHDYYITRNRMYFGMKYASFRTKLALLRESLRLFISGREWQKRAVLDFYLGKFGRGSFQI